MSNEKRMIEGYEVKTAIHIGGKEIIFAENMAASEPYMACDCSWENPLSIDSYDNAVVSEDYLEIMTEFLGRVSDVVQQIQTRRTERGVTDIPLTADDCDYGSSKAWLKNELVVIKPEYLSPDSRTADHQLVLATGGNGCDPYASGRAVYCQNLFTGKEARWERQQIAGILRMSLVPDWVRERLDALEAKEKERPSVLEKLSKNKNVATQQPSKQKPKKNNQPEL